MVLIGAREVLQQVYIQLGTASTVLVSQACHRSVKWRAERIVVTKRESEITIKTSVRPVLALLCLWKGHFTSACGKIYSVSRIANSEAGLHTSFSALSGGEELLKTGAFDGTGGAIQTKQTFQELR